MKGWVGCRLLGIDCHISQSITPPPARTKVVGKKECLLGAS